MYLQSNNETLSCNHCCSGKLNNTTYSECVFVALAIKNEIHMSHNVICGLPGSTLFFQIITLTAGFKKKKTLLIIKRVF
jgi:hypothetical protein